MRSLHCILLFASLAIAPSTAYADTPVPNVAGGTEEPFGPAPQPVDFTQAVDAGTNDAGAGVHVNLINPGSATTQDAVKDAAILITQAHTTTAWHLALAGLISLLLKLLVDFLHSLRTPRDEVKKALPWILSGLGVVIGVLDYWVRGANWIDAMILGGGAPASVLVNELANVVRDWLQKPAALPSGAKLLPFAVLVAAAYSGCISAYCKDPQHVTEQSCRAQQATVDCKNMAMGDTLTINNAESVVGAIVSNGPNYIGDLLSVAATIGKGGWEFVVCELHALEQVYGKAMASESSEEANDAPRVLARIHGAIAAGPKINVANVQRAHLLRPLVSQ